MKGLLTTSVFIGAGRLGLVVELLLLHCLGNCAKVEAHHGPAVRPGNVPFHGERAIGPHPPGSLVDLKG